MGLPENEKEEIKEEIKEEASESSSTNNSTVEVAENKVEPEKKWYILRVQSGKEDRVKKNLEKRIAAENKHHLIARIVIPNELVSEIKKGLKRVVQRKLYPGYVMIEMLLTEETHFLVKNTPGVGDFVGPASGPIPMSEDEVEKMLLNVEQVRDKPKPKVSFRKGQNIKIKEGPFENFDGIVDEVNEQKGIVKVIVGIFGRYTQVELEYWQVESL